MSHDKPDKRRTCQCNHHNVYITFIITLSVKVRRIFGYAMCDVVLQYLSLVAILSLINMKVGDTRD